MQTPPQPLAWPHENDESQVGLQPAQSPVSGSQVRPFEMQSTQATPPEPHLPGRFPVAQLPVKKPPE